MSNPEEEYPSPRRGHPARAVVNGAPASPYTLVPIHLLSQISSLHTFPYTFVPTHLPYPAPLSLHIRCLTLFSLYISPALPFCPNAFAPPYRGGVETHVSTRGRMQDSFQSIQGSFERIQPDTLPALLFHRSTRPFPFPTSTPPHWITTSDTQPMPSR